MALEPGQKLLHYRIVDKLGEGGMGAVWRAVDTTLDREVAIKILSEAFSTDTERVARFDREAKVLASLNHPNIAAVHSVHEHNGARFIAQELVPGEDLAAVLARGRMDRDDALRTAVQIAQGLEAAHERGVVHRDLKPSNVQLEPGGRAKILDFGLAKAFAPSAAAAGSKAEASLSISPTMTAGGTVVGMILGTAGYMSPEQARGGNADRRSDIWSFGCVLFEMLSGERVFDGDTVSDALASILKVDPDFSRLPADTPAPIRRLLRRCLHKDPDHRLHDAADARIVIEDVLAGRDDPDAAEPAAPRRTRLPAVLAAAGLGLVAGVLLWSFVDQAAPPAGAAGPSPVRRFGIPLPDGEPLSWADSIAISPDGSVLALNVGLDGQRLLYLRRLDSLDFEVIPGTEGARSPFFSPDGEYLAFFAGSELKRVSLRGGSRDVTVLCDAPDPYRGTWSTGGWIYFTFGQSRLARVRGDGGDPEELGEVGDVHHLQALPDNRGILLTLQGADSPSTRKDTSKIAVLSPDDKTVKPVLDGGYNTRYLPSGHLVFMRAGGLFAVPFDLERLEASPPAVSVQPQVWTDSVYGFARYDTSSDGTLIYVSGGDYARTVPTWIDLETGEEQPLPLPPGTYNNLDLSPDGTRLAIQNLSGAQDQVWVHDSRRGTFTRLTLDGANVYPVWSHDGTEVFFASSRDGEYRLFRKPVNGSAPASRLLTDEQEALMETDIRWPSSVTPDGKFLLIYTWAHPIRGGDLWKVPLAGSGDPEPVLATGANEIVPQVSPDGKWLAYVSNQTGPPSIVVRPFPDVERREWIVSGGYDPRWSPRGDALLYRQGWGRLMSVPVGDGDEFDPGVARELLQTDFHDAKGSSFAVSPDGKRVLVNKPVAVSIREETPVTLVTGWAGEVSRVAGRE